MFFVTLILTVLQCKCFVSVDLCMIVPTLKFQLSKEGFHRELYYSVEITADQDDVWSGCPVLFLQTIPSGSYVNPDELADLRRVNKVIACPDDFVNVETPKYESTPHIVYIYARLRRAGNALTADANLPVHVRYHRANIGGRSNTVVLEPPELLLQTNLSLECGERRDAPCGPCHQDMCEWFSVHYSNDTKSISIEVPVGNMNHASFVIVITLLTTIASALYLCKVVVDSKRVARVRKKK